MGWLAGWNYRKTVTITGQAGAGTNYQVNLSIGDASGGDFHLENHCTSFPNDIQVTDNDQTTPLDYWVEDLTIDPISMWVEVADSLDGNADVCVYYRKSGESSASNIASTFLFGDGFDSDTLNPAWTFVQSGQGGDSYSLTANPGKIRITGSKQANHTPITLLKRIAESGNYIQEIMMNDSWNANYKNSGLYVGDGGVLQANDRILGQVMHESSGSPDTAVWTEKMVSSTRTIAAAVRFTEPSWPSDILMRFTKAGTNFTAAVVIAGTTTTGTTQAYTSTSTSNGIVINNDDDANTFTADFDNFRVRKYNSPEPAYLSASAEESAPAGAIMNQFQKANLGADLFDGGLIT